MADKPEDNIHGEEEVKPRYDYRGDGSGDSFGVYDSDEEFSDPSQSETYNATQRPASSSTGGGGERRFGFGRNRSEGTTGSSSNEGRAVSRSDLGDQEASATSGASGAIDPTEQRLNDRLSAAREQRQIGKGFSKESSGANFNPFSRIKGLRFSRRSIAGIAAIGIIGGGGFFGVAILSGPFQFIHLAQNLQKFHLKSNEDFGNDRTSKILLYALAGKGAQNGRLGVTGNAAANKWEKRLLNESGMRPVYTEGTRRFVGFEIVDENKAQNTLGDLGDQNSRNSRRVEQSLGKGAKITSADGLGGVVNPDGNKLGKGTRFVDLRDVGFKDRRVWIKTIGKATKVNNVSSAVGSRLLIKRAGVDFHPLNKAKNKVDAKIADAFRKRRADNIQNGTQSGPGGVEAGSSGKDENGNDKPPEQADIDASSETKSYIDDFKNSGAFKSAKGAAIITGVLCATKALGNSVEDYKYANNVLPMERMGWQVVSTGNQAMAGDDFDLGTLGLMRDYLYNSKLPQSKRSYNQAESIRAEEGKTGGVPIQQEADLGKAGEKPKFFQIIDGIPVLGSVCGVQNAIGNLPIIKQVGAFGNKAVEEAAGAFGVNIDEIMKSALKALAGKTIDPLASGADFGNLANTGMFLAGNDQAIGMGGSALTDGERTNLAMADQEGERQDQESKSFASRYFDVYDSNSVASSIIDSSPTSTSQAASMVAGSFTSIGSGFSSLFSAFVPKAKAATRTNYDYGMAKYGFSLTERNNPDFENPYENGTKPIRNDGGPSIEDDLPRLNEMYGEPCFGISVTADDSGVHINTKDKSEMKNVYKNLEGSKKKSECDKTKNTSDRFNHYRMYVADAVNAVSLACYEGDDSACRELGAGGSSAASSASGSASASQTTGDDDTKVSGDAQSLAKQILDAEKENKISIQDYSEDMNADRATRSLASQQLADIADGKKASLSTRCSYSLPKDVEPEVKLLQFLVDLSGQTKYTINVLFGQCHSGPDSNHHKGKAVDFGCPLNTGIADRVGKKYGISHNDEACGGKNNHWHYSIGGN